MSCYAPVSPLPPLLHYPVTTSLFSFPRPCPMHLLPTSLSHALRCTLPHQLLLPVFLCYNSFIPRPILSLLKQVNSLTPPPTSSLLYLPCHALFYSPSHFDATLSVHLPFKLLSPSVPCHVSPLYTRSPNPATPARQFAPLPSLPRLLIPSSHTFTLLPSSFPLCYANFIPLYYFPSFPSLH